MKHRNRITNFLFKLISVAFVFAVVVAAPVHAQDASGVTPLFNPLAGKVDASAPIQSLAAIFIDLLFGIAGSVALAMYVWGGFLWLTSAGNEKQVTQGKGVFQWTTLGVIMMFAAYTLVSYIFSSVGTGTAGGAATGAGSAGGGGGGAPAAAGSTDKCCVDYVKNKATTVSNAGACTGPQTYVYAGACDKLKYCGIDPTVVGPSQKCTPVPKAGSCGKDVPEFLNSFNECIINQGLPPTKAVAEKPFCCYAVTAKKGFPPIDIQAADQKTATENCIKQPKPPDGGRMADPGTCGPPREWCYTEQFKSCGLYVQGVSKSCKSIHSTWSSCETKMQ